MRLPLMVTVPETGVPGVAPDGRVPNTPVVKSTVNTTVPPAGTLVWSSPPAIACVITSDPMATWLIAPSAVPEFVKVRRHVLAAPGGVVVPLTLQIADAPTVTFAELPRVPKRPKAKPAMATPATRVIAIRMTVARTGEMAFRFFATNLLKFMGLGS